MHEKFVCLSHKEVPALPEGYSVMLNIEERIVTLLGPQDICAQSRFSHSAFRILGLLLRAPNGADYAELLACLRCSHIIFRKMLVAPSYEQGLEFLAPQVERWDRHLERTTLQGRIALEKELKMVRRATKERQGANSILRKNGFALTIRALYRKGYLLVRAPMSPQENRVWR